MNKLAGFLWLALMVSLLGWYGWALAFGGAILYVLIALLWEHITEKHPITAKGKAIKKMRDKEIQEWRERQALINSKKKGGNQ